MRNGEEVAYISMLLMSPVWGSLSSGVVYQSGLRRRSGGLFKTGQ